MVALQQKAQGQMMFRCVSEHRLQCQYQLARNRWRTTLYPKLKYRSTGRKTRRDAIKS
eukprot:gene202-816_t